MQGVRDSSLSVTTSATLTLVTGYDDNDGNRWGGPANVFCVFYKTGGSITTATVGAGTAILIPTTGAHAVALVQTYAVSGGSYGVPTGYTSLAATAAMAGWIAHGSSHGHGWNVTATAGVLSAYYEDDAGTQYPGYANVFGIATI